MGGVFRFPAGKVLQETKETKWENAKFWNRWLGNGAPLVKTHLTAQIRLLKRHEEDFLTAKYAKKVAGKEWHTRFRQLLKWGFNAQARRPGRGFERF